MLRTFSRNNCALETVLVRRTAATELVYVIFDTLCSVNPFFFRYYPRWHSRRVQSRLSVCLSVCLLSAL